jgi:CPA1 family monovalent cation:H+ antiporter
MANSLLFLLIGLQIDRTELFGHLTFIVVAIIVTVLVRAMAVYGLSGLAGLFGDALPRSWQHVMNWGGLKGSIPVALALGLPAGLQYRDSIVSTVFGVVAFSLFAQGLTIRPLLEHLGLVRMTDIELEYEQELGRSIGLNAAIEELENLHENGQISHVLYEELRENLEDQQDEVRADLAEYFGRHDVIRRSQFRTARRRILSAQRSAIDDAFRRGLISEETLRNLRRDIDAQFSTEEIGRRLESTVDADQKEGEA